MGGRVHRGGPQFVQVTMQQPCERDRIKRTVEHEARSDVE